MTKQTNLKLGGIWAYRCGCLFGAQYFDEFWLFDVQLIDSKCFPTRWQQIGSFHPGQFSMCPTAGSTSPRTVAIHRKTYPPNGKRSEAPLPTHMHACLLPTRQNTVEMTGTVSDIHNWSNDIVCGLWRNTIDPPPPSPKVWCVRWNVTDRMQLIDSSLFGSLSCG